MKHTGIYDIEVSYDIDDGVNVITVHSSYTKGFLGIIHYDDVIEKGTDDEINDYINSNLRQ